MPKEKAEPPKLHEVEPAETTGRETIARYRAQFRAAAYECLTILDGGDIDRIYCDYQDDFVTRSQSGDGPVYHFYQVKTKGKRNFQWTKLDLLGLYKRRKQTAKRIAASFVGKLMFHTIRFKTNCGSIVFLTNVHVDDDVEDIISALKNEEFFNDDLKAFVEHFNEAFVEGDPLDEEAILGHIKKLLLKPGISYLHPHDNDFDALARDAIFRYSEIDLNHAECKEIVQGLIDLVEKKSFTKLIAELDEAALDDAAGIGVTDLLDILCISKGAYAQLQAGGDASAVRNASIIQRILQDGGASESMVEFCSKCKVDWDMWLRDKRHTLPEFDLNFLLAQLNDVKNKLTTGESSLSEIRQEIDKLWDDLTERSLAQTLTRELLLGGVFSELVRSEAQ